MQAQVNQHGLQMCQNPQGKAGIGGPNSSPINRVGKEYTAESKQGLTRQVHLGNRRTETDEGYGRRHTAEFIVQSSSQRFSTV